MSAKISRQLLAGLRQPFLTRAGSLWRRRRLSQRVHMTTVHTPIYRWQSENSIPAKCMLLPSPNRTKWAPQKEHHIVKIVHTCPSRKFLNWIRWKGFTKFLIFFFFFNKSNKKEYVPHNNQLTPIFPHNRLLDNISRRPHNTVGQHTLCQWISHEKPLDRTEYDSHFDLVLFVYWLDCTNLVTKRRVLVSDNFMMLMFEEYNFLCRH